MDIDVDAKVFRPPLAELDHEHLRIAWPYGGLPVALDLAAAAMFDCFASPLSARELAADLATVTGLSTEEAERSAADLVGSLVRTGHLIPEGMRPMPASLLGYPPSASP